MELRDIRTLTLLQELDNEESPPTQRELAERLDVSLGLVNLYLKQLVQKSYFKIKTYPKNRVGYLLTPAGFMEKSRLTYAYIHHSLSFYKMAKEKLKAILQKLETEGVRTIAFHGANEIAEIAYLALKETNLELTAVIDDAKVGQNFMGHTILSSAAVTSIVFDRLLDNVLQLRSGAPEKRTQLAVPQDKMVSMVME